MRSAAVQEVPEQHQVQALLEELVQEHEECAVQVQEQPALASAALQGHPVSSTQVEVQGLEEHQVRRRLDLPPFSTHTMPAALQSLPWPQALGSDQVQQERVQQQIQVRQR